MHLVAESVHHPHFRTSWNVRACSGPTLEYKETRIEFISAVSKGNLEQKKIAHCLYFDKNNPPQKIVLLIVPRYLISHSFNFELKDAFLELGPFTVLQTNNLLKLNGPIRRSKFSQMHQVILIKNSQRKNTHSAEKKKKP